jgi:RNA polymerase sigma factor (sigma-70 family)
VSEFVLKPTTRELAVASSAGTHDRPVLVREICVGAGAAVVSVAHKPSPDVPHRVAIGQSHAAARWGAEHGLGADPSVAEKAEAAADFERVRSRLFGIAHRTLSRAADAEDVVQDVWIRWQGVDRAAVRDRMAFLSIVTTRVALNVVTSARVRHEVSLGVNLPERDDAAADPAVEAERGEKLGLAVHILIERLSPVERAVYVLREAFGYSFRDISEAFGLGEANARQLARRARAHLAEERHNPVDPAERDRLLEAFLDAARAGDMARLIGLLTDGVVQSGRSGQIGSRLPAVATG